MAVKEYTNEEKQDEIISMVDPHTHNDENSVFLGSKTVREENIRATDTPQVVGDVLYQSADTERTTSNTTYTKVKEIAVYRPGDYRIKFDLKTSDGSLYGNGKVYKNGTPIGTERTAGVYTTFSEDISGWSAGDLIQLYYKSSLQSETDSPEAGNGGGNTTVDGSMRHYTGADLAWATIRGGAGTDAFPVVDGGSYCDIWSGATANWLQITRGILTFDTSGLPDDATIASASLSVYFYDRVDDFTQTIYLCDATPASNNALVAGDYAQVGTTKYSAGNTFASITLGQFTSISLNATGLAAISKTGITKIGSRSSSDIDNSEPGFVANKKSYLAGYYADQGSPYVPYLTINYTVPTSTKNFRLYVAAFDGATVNTD